MKSLIISIAFATFVLMVWSAPISDEDIQAFQAWSAEYNKVYSSPEEEQAALSNWLANKARIDAHNQKFEAGKVAFTRGLFKYSDLSPQEKAQHLAGVVFPPQARAATVAKPFPAGPAAIDWGLKGLVGPVMEQGLCSSCWAFSAAGVVEGVMRRKNVGLSMSTQQLLDCSTNYCYGCNGGWPKNALDYVKTNGLIDDENYPYYGEKSDQCYYQYPGDMVGYVNATFQVAVKGNETLLKNIVAAVGPTSVIICINNSFYNYRSGVYANPGCCSPEQYPTNHAVLVTGYGTDYKSGDYWIVKNSWGTSWGEEGYIRIARNQNNTCNIANSAVYAT